ncbi:unnamed protein product [Dracunculus medinensis]|uniref:MFS domain-containing protein n=1 Tax=Dracunculus medinensis TaxID=318479 RepID=A0A158Q5F8_DRAME|nr:unnamed protein product [Dracunculus medinensis]
MRSDPAVLFLMKLSPFARTIIVTSGAVLIHLSLGTYHTFGNMLPYMASFMKNFTDSSISEEKLIWIPNFQGCFPFAMVIGGSLNSRTNARVAAFVGCFFMTLGTLLTFWTIQMSFSLFLITYGIMFGLGQGMAYVITMSVAINWARDHIGLISGIVAAGFGISSSVFTPIQTLLINPMNYKPTKSGYFTEKELTSRVPSVFYILAIIYTFMQLLGLLVICDPPDVSSSADDQRSDDNNNDDDIIPPGLAKAADNRSMKTIDVTYGETFIDDDIFLAFAFSACSFLNAVARIGWGFLVDRIGFQVEVVCIRIILLFYLVCLAFATFLATLLLISMPLASFGGKWMYFIWMCSMFICMACTHASFITATIRCFGTKNKSLNYGFLILSTTYITAT